MLTPQEIEAQYQLRLHKQMCEQQLNKFINPDRDISLEGVWVAYLWYTPDKENPAVGEWILAGFRRRRNLRRVQTMGRFFAKIRRKLGIDKKTPVLLYDLDMAVRRSKDPDQTWRFRPPQFGRRMPKFPQITPVIDRKRRKTRVKQRALIFNPKKTKFIALGRNGPWDRKRSGYLYLGPLQSEMKRQAQFEIKRLFPVYQDLLVIPVGELSKPLRAGLIRNRRVRAGVTRMAWPEVPPTFERMWDKFVRHLVKAEFHNAIEVDDPGLIDTRDALRAMWEEQKCPWLTMTWFRKQINSWSKECRSGRKQIAKKARKNSGRKPSVKRARTSVTSKRTRRASKRAKTGTSKTTRLSRVLPRKRVVQATVRRLHTVTATLRRKAG